MVQKQLQQKLNHDHSTRRDYKVGDSVYFRNFSNGPKWLPGVVMQLTGPLSYTVKLPNGRWLKRHVDHILPQVGETEAPAIDASEITEKAAGIDDNHSHQPSPQVLPPTLLGEDTPTSESNSPLNPPINSGTSEKTVQPIVVDKEDVPRRRSSSERGPPNLESTTDLPLTPQARPTRIRRLPEHLRDFMLERVYSD